MLSSNPLRPQNRAQQDQAGLTSPFRISKPQEPNKTKPNDVPSSKRGAENVDPSASSEAGKGVNKLRGVSRLPVLAKSLQPSLTELPQNPSWEQRPLTGKTPKKRTCTKPVPFSLSQSRAHSQRNTDIATGKTSLTRSGTKQRNLNSSVKTASPGVLRTHSNKFQQTGGNHVERLELSKATSSDSSNGCPPKTETELGRCNQTDLSSRLGNITLVQSKRPEDSGLSQFCKTPAIKANAGVTFDGQTPKDAHQSATSTQSHASTTGSCSALSSAMHNVLLREGSGAGRVEHMMPRLSTCPPGPGASNNLPQRVSVKKSHHDVVRTTELAGSFSPDPLALNSILQNEGVTVGGPARVSICPTGRGTSVYFASNASARKTQKEVAGKVTSVTGDTLSFSPDPSALRGILQNNGATPCASTRPSGRGTSVYSAQRVPVKKSQSENSTAVPPSAGNAVSFSPDPAALRSILQNEGIRGAGPVGTTPRVSVCPTGRGTSFYSAQRVPVKKTTGEASAAVPNCANRTPAMKWTPQRVPNTKPLSMRKFLSTQKASRFRDSPDSSGPQDPGTESLMRQEGENVVQRLFEEPEQMDDDHVDKNDVTSHQLLNIDQPNELQTMKENSDLNHHTENEKKTAQPFIQASHRGSVIVFSSSQKLVGSGRAQDTMQTLGAGTPLQLRGNNATSHNTRSLQSEQCNGSQITSSIGLIKQINTSTQSQSKAPQLAHPVSVLRRRHPPLEEMFLDDECATYTSRLLSCQTQPRCDNPVATMLLFQDSTCFLPIGLSSPVRLSPVPSGSSIRA